MSDLRDSLTVAATELFNAEYKRIVGVVEAALGENVPKRGVYPKGTPRIKGGPLLAAVEAHFRSTGETRAKRIALALGASHMSVQQAIGRLRKAGRMPLSTHPNATTNRAGK